jgi:hypothetical protein
MVSVLFTTTLVKNTQFHYFMTEALYSPHDLRLVKLFPEVTEFSKPMGLANQGHVTRIKLTEFKPSFVLKTTEALVEDTVALAERAVAAEAEGPRLTPRTADSVLLRPATLIGARIDFEAKRPKYDPGAVRMQNPKPFVPSSFDARKAAAAAKHLARMAAGRAARGL